MNEHIAVLQAALIHVPPSAVHDSTTSFHPSLELPPQDMLHPSVVSSLKFADRSRPMSDPSYELIENSPLAKSLYSSSHSKLRTDFYKS